MVLAVGLPYSPQAMVVDDWKPRKNPRSLPSPKTREGGISYFDIIGNPHVSVTMTPSVSDEGE